MNAFKNPEFQFLVAETTHTHTHTLTERELDRNMGLVGGGGGGGGGRQTETSTHPPTHKSLHQSKRKRFQDRCGKDGLEPAADAMNLCLPLQIVKRRMMLYEQGQRR